MHLSPLIIPPLVFALLQPLPLLPVPYLCSRLISLSELRSQEAASPTDPSNRRTVERERESARERKRETVFGIWESLYCNSSDSRCTHLISHLWYSRAIPNLHEFGILGVYAECASLYCVWLSIPPPMKVHQQIRWLFFFFRIRGMLWLWSWLGWVCRIEEKPALHLCRHHLSWRLTNTVNSIFDMFTYWLCYLHCYQINIGCKQFLDYCIVYCLYS